MADEGGASFKFKVKLSTLRLARVDDAEEDDFKSFAITTLTGQGTSDLWYHEAPADAADPDPSSNLGKTSVTNGFEAAYNFTRNSPAIGLNDDTVGALAGATLSVRVFKGSSRHTSTDTLIGSFSVPMGSLLEGSPISGRYDLAVDGDEAEYKGSLDLAVSVDGVLETYCRGSRLVTVGGVSMLTPPGAWCPTPAGLEEGAEPTPEQIQEALADPENPRVPFRYVLEVGLPAGTGPRAPKAGAGDDADGEGADAGAAGGEGGEGGDGDGEAAAAAAAPEESPIGPTVSVILQGGVLGYHKIDDVFGSKEEEEDGGDGGDADDLEASKLEEDDTEGKGEEDGDGEDGAGAGASPPPAYEWRITWDASVNAYLSKSALDQLNQAMEAGLGLTAVIKRIKVSTNPETGELQYLDEDMMSRGQANVALDDLLVPGGLQAIGEYSVTPKEVSEAEKAAAAAAAAEREAAAAAAGKGKKGKAAKGKKGKDAPPEEEPAPEVNIHESSGAVLGVCLTVDSPLVLRPPTPPAPKLSPEDLIPSRPEPLKGPPGMTASAEFREDVALVVHAISEQYVKILRELSDSADGSDRETRRRQLLTALNSSGLYHAMKERLKRSAVRIVRERFNKTASLEDDAARDTFVSQLYTYLVGQAHRSMNAAFAEAEAALDTGSRAVPPTSAAGKLSGGVAALLTAPSHSPKSKQRGGFGQASDVESKEESEPARLGRVADEAEFEGNMERAAAAHQSCIAWCERQVARGLASGYDAAPWHAYAEFNLRRGNVPKATECLRECIAIDPRRLPSLTLMGCIATQDNDPTRSVTMLRAAVEEATKVGSATELACLNHILLALAHENAGDMEGSSASISAAVKSLRDSGLALLDGKDADPVVDAVVAPSEAYLKASKYLVDKHLLGLAEVALGRAAATLADQDVPKALQVELRLQEGRQFHLSGGSNLRLAMQRLDAAIELDSGCNAAWETKGRIELDDGNLEAARTALELAVGTWEGEGEGGDDGAAASSPSSASSPSTPLLIRLARLYVTLGRASDPTLLDSGREVFLRAAKQSGWAIAWMGASQAALLAGERSVAEAGLNEANVRDNHNPEVWAWLSLLCMTESPAPRELEGAQALDNALKLGLDSGSNAGLLEDIAGAFSAAGKNQVAEKVLLRVVGATNAPKTRLQLGNALAAQAKHEEALAEFQAVLTTGEDSGHYRTARAGAVEALQTLGRASEAAKLRAQYA